MSPLEILRQRLEELRSQIDTTRTRATEILGMPQDQLTPELLNEASQLRSGLVGMHTRRDDLEGQIREEEAAEQRSATARAAQVEHGTVPEVRTGGTRVTREERTYTAEKSRRGEASFFVDAFRSQLLGDSNAAQRLGRHAQEVAVEGEGTQARATTTSSYGGLVVPQYLVDLAAPVLRAGRPLANTVNQLPLPAQGMTLDVPRGTTGAAAASQATQNTALQNTDEVWTDLVVPVCTIGGQQDVSRQSLERGTPGVDQIVFTDLSRAYNAELDRQVANGSGASGQMLGILQTSGRYQSSVYGAALTTAAFYTKSAGALSAIASSGTMVTPNVWVMHPRRWYWLSAQVDSQNRPLVVPAANGVMNGLAVNTNPGGYSADGPDSMNPQVVGIYQGLPVIIDANMPTNLGTVTTEDAVLAMDSSKAYLWEDNGGVPRQLRFEQTLGQNLTVKLVLFNYAAFTAGRYPVAFGQVGGNESAGAGVNGQIAPTF